MNELYHIIQSNRVSQIALVLFVLNRDLIYECCAANSSEVPPGPAESNYGTTMVPQYQHRIVCTRRGRNLPPFICQFGYSVFSL